MLLSQMAGTEDNQGALDFAIVRLRQGSEPPPHVHSREDEYFYVLSGELRAFVDGKVFSLSAGEFIFLPRRKPHAWLITSEQVKAILVAIPGGFYNAFKQMSAPAGRMDLPASADSVTYATADLTETVKVFQQYGIRLLTPDEIRAEMPQFPLQGR